MESINMFDKEIVKEKLKEIYKSNSNEINWGAVINSYTIVDGFYVFRVEDNAYFFTENTLMDWCPGYFLL